MPFDPAMFLRTSLVDIARLMVWLAVLSAVFIPLERLFPLHRRPARRKGLGADIVYYFLAGLIPAMLMSIPLWLVSRAGHRLVPGEVLDRIAHLPFWVRAAAALLLTETGYYWGHRWTHEIPILWRFHAVHHAAEEIDYLVSTHAHPVDTAFSHMCSLAPVYFLGLAAPAAESGSMVAVAVNVIGQCWGYFLHSNLRVRLGFLESLISSPAFHHWHHNRGTPVDRNYASMLPWLDRMFGTHHLPPKAWPEAYGIDGEMPDGIGGQLLEPFTGSAARRAAA